MFTIPTILRTEKGAQPINICLKAANNEIFNWKPLINCTPKKWNGVPQKIIEFKVIFIYKGLLSWLETGDLVPGGLKDSPRVKLPLPTSTWLLHILFCDLKFYHFYLISNGTRYYFSLLGNWWEMKAVAWWCWHRAQKSTFQVLPKIHLKVYTGFNFMIPHSVFVLHSLNSSS